MTIEEEFFKAFGIEKRCIEKNPTYCCDYENCDECRGLGYPSITAERLLKLICIHTSWCEPRLCSHNINELKEQVLSDLMIDAWYEELKQEVQAVFEERLTDEYYKISQECSNEQL